MLRNGAASFRSEEAMCRVALALGAERIEAYVTPTGIIASVHSGPEHRTQIARVRSIGVDMNRISALEYLSRHHSATVTEIRLQLDQIENLPRQYPMLVTIIMVGLACGAFAMIVGGGPLEAAAAALSAGLMQAVRMRLAEAHLNVIPQTAICATFASSLSLFLVHLLNSTRPEAAVIASVLGLVPGVLLLTSLLDLLRFYLVSGLTRALYASLIIVTIGVGILITLTLTGFVLV